MIEAISETQLTPAQADLWNKARQAVEVNNYGYAVSLLKALVVQIPGFLEGRKTLRACSIRLNPTPKKKGLFGGSKVSVSKKDPAATMASAEDALESDPYSEGANEALFNAAKEAGLNDVASFALETVREGHPDNKKLLHVLADHYIELSQFEEAAGVYHDILKVDPADAVAGKGETACMARASMSKKWDAEEGKRASADLSKVDKQGMTRQEMEERLASLSAQYALDQTNLGIVRDIAGIYEQMEDWSNAYSFYSYAYTLSGSDVSLKGKSEDMQAKVRESQLADMEKRAAANPDDPAIQAQLEEARQTISQQMVADAKARVEANPTDPQLRFDLGQALFNAKEYTEAIPELQRSRNNPYLRIRAMLMLGKCYEAKSMDDMALRQLDEANKELTVMDATKLEILYLMGTLNEKLGKKQEALDCFKMIYDSNYGYKDVAQRVESAYQG